MITLDWPASLAQASQTQSLLGRGRRGPELTPRLVPSPKLFLLLSVRLWPVESHLSWVWGLQENMRTQARFIAIFLSFLLIKEGLAASCLATALQSNVSAHIGECRVDGTRDVSYRIDSGEYSCRARTSSHLSRSTLYLASYHAGSNLIFRCNMQPFPSRLDLPATSGVLQGNFSLYRVRICPEVVSR